MQTENLILSINLILFCSLIVAASIIESARPRHDDNGIRRCAIDWQNNNHTARHNEKQVKYTYVTIVCRYLATGMKIFFQNSSEGFGFWFFYNISVSIIVTHCNYRVEDSQCRENNLRSDYICKEVSEPAVSMDATATSRSKFANKKQTA